MPKVKKRFATAIILVLLFGASDASDSRRTLLKNPELGAEEFASSREAALEFLADLPELKNLSLRISEQAFLKILVLENLTYRRSAADDIITYYVTVPRKDRSAKVIVGFENGFCSGIQRMSDGL